MLDENGQRRFSEQMHTLWIQPELDKRFAESGIPSDFRIRECLIKLPKNQLAVVEFNDEIAWEVEFEVAPDVSIEVDQLVYSHEFVSLKKVMPPKLEGKRVAFVYLYWAGFSYRTAFDFAPNHDDFDEENSDFNLEEAIARHLRIIINERIVIAAHKFKPQLEQIGLWTVTSLLPYPISKIIERIGENDLHGARTILVDHCNSDFIENKLVKTWTPIKVFQVRFTIFQEALFSHRSGKYHASIYTLIPQIEGVITDWLYENINLEPVKWKTESKIDQLHQIMQRIPQFEYVWREALESVHSFLRHSQPMQSFTDWLGSIDPSFPGRHPVAHGKYVDQMFTKENSIKLFLLLDTICQFMMFYEARVLGRDLSEESD